MLLLVAGALQVEILCAQDTHYSQYFNVPLSLNPALTGKIDGTFRVTFNYRNQWLGITSGKSTFSTPTFSADFPIRFKSKDILGIGVNMINDRSAGGRLTNFSGMLSLAYHKSLGNSRDHYLSWGVQGGFLQKRLDLANIRLADQIFLQDEMLNGISADQLPGNVSGFDLQAGFDWSSKFSEKVSMNAGYAAFHVLQPDFSFSQETNKLPIRHTAHFGADFRLAQKFKLLPSFVYMTRAKAQEITTGLSAGIPFTDEVALYLGGYYRLNDAVIPYFGMDIKGLRLAVSYDLTASDLQRTGGGLEISLIYTGRYIPVPDVTPSLYCPRF